jgi:sugar diacid utilization regulator
MGDKPVPDDQAADGAGRQRAPGARLADGSVPADDIARENVALRRLVTVYRHLSGMAAQDADLTSVSELIAGHAQATVAVVDPAMDILAAAAPGEPAALAVKHVREFVVHPRLGEILSAASSARRPLRFPDVGTSAAVIVAPVLVGDDVPAYLLTLVSGQDRAGEDASLLLTEHAATICGVIIGRDRVVAAAASRARYDLVEGLLSGRGQQDGDLERWARHLGYDAGTDHHAVCVIVDADGEATARDALRQRAAAAAEHFLSAHAPDAIISLRDAEVVMVLPEPVQNGRRSRAEQAGQMCIRRLSAVLPQAVAVVGIGGACREPASVATSYAQARRAAETARRLDGASRVIAFEDLGIRRLLLQVPSLAELRGFADEVLGRVITADSEHSAAYLATLACYFRENSSLRQAAAKLHVHPNTISYRIHRIEYLTGLDLSSYRDRLMAEVALEILDTIGDGRPAISADGYCCATGRPGRCCMPRATPSTARCPT